jgi:hypothetical protein
MTEIYYESRTQERVNEAIINLCITYLTNTQNINKLQYTPEQAEKSLIDNLGIQPELAKAAVSQFMSNDNNETNTNCMLIKHYKLKDSSVKFDLTFKDELTLIMCESDMDNKILYEAIEHDVLLNNKKNILLLDYHDMLSGNIKYVLETAKNKVIAINHSDTILESYQRVQISMDTNNQYIVFTHNIDGFKPVDKSIATLVIKDKIGKLEYQLLDKRG